MKYKSTNETGQSHGSPWTLPRVSSADTVRRLRYSLLFMLLMLCGGSVWADDVTIEEGTFNGKNATYTEGWTTTGTGKGRTDCIIIGTGENITSPSLNLSQYSKVTISIKARRYGTLNGSKATIDASIGGTSVGTTDANGTNATTALTDIEFTPTAAMTAVSIVFTCTNATSAGSTHGAGINTITITGTEATSDNRTATTISFADGYATSGVVGGSINLPTATVMAGETAVEGATFNWTSSNESVATIGDGVINLLAVGTTTIKAEYAGDDTYKNSEKSYTVTVTAAPITTAGALNDAAKDGGNSGKTVTYNFANTKVVYVSGSYNYIADATGYALLYGSSLKLTAGKLITGTLTGTAKTYNGLPEIAVTNINVTSTTDDTETATPTTITVDKLGDNINNYIKIESATYVSADGQNLTFKVGETSFIVRNQFKLDVSALEANKVYNITGFGSEYTTSDSRTLQVYLTEIAEATPTIQYVHLWASVSSSTATAEEVATVSQALFDRDSGFPANYDAVSNSKELFTLDETTGKYTLSYTNVNVPADGMGISWTALINKNSLASSTFKWVDIDKAGLYDITFTYDPTATENQLTATATKKDFYILGVEDLNEDNNTWSLPADMKQMTWNADAQAYKYELNNTSTASFCFSTNNEVSDWDTFNSTYRWAPGEGDTEFSLDWVGIPLTLLKANGTIKLPAGTWTISIAPNDTPGKMDMTITGEAATVEEHTYIVAGSEAEIFGTSWDGTNEANKMTKQTDGTYQKTYTVDQAYKGVQLKVVKNGSDWIGDDTGNNVSFNLTGAGNFTVSINPETSAITVSGSIVQFVSTLEFETISVVGNGDETWLNNVAWDPACDDNQMMEIADGIWEITFENVAEGTERQIKFALDGAWTHNFGGTFSEFGEATDAVYNGDNITFNTVEELQNIKIQLDLREFDFTTKQGAKFTITSETGDDDISGVFFSADVIATESQNFATGTTEITSTQATITGGKMYAISEQTDAKALINQQNSVYYFSMTNNNTYFKVELDNALAVGDVITAKGNGGVKNNVNKGLWVSTSASRPSEAPACAGTSGTEGFIDNLLNYTVTEGDEYVGVKTLYIYRAAGATQYFDEFTITRPASEEPAAEDVTATWDFVNNCAQLASKNEGGTYTSETMASNVDGISMTIAYNGGQIKNNDNSYQVTNGVVMQIPVKNAGDEVTVVGYPGYYKYSIGGTDATEQTTTHKATAAEAAQGYVEVTSTDDNNYINSITVTQYAPKEATTLDNEPATVTFPFDLGTEGQKATFSNADYWLNSKVAWGSNFTVNGTRTVSDITETQLKATAKETEAAESNLIKFTITPKPGFTFTPTKVTFTATRVGTDDGALDVAWLNSDKTTATLANLKKADSNLPARENGTPNYTTFSYDLTTVNGIVAGEGECGLQFNLYSINGNKNYGFANIIIEGTLSGTEEELPILASFKANGTEYSVEDVFGDQYEATLELSKKETIISESNPLTDITATSGDPADAIYSNQTESSCTVTIPVTAGTTTMEYVLNIVQKPDFTLTYIGVDGTSVLETQQVEKDAKIGEFVINIANVPAITDGYKARGWFKNNYVGEKWTTESVITADAKLYAVETEIEVSSDSKKYVYDLTDKNFDADDHEAFNPTGSGKWHDNQHGWAFANGDKIDLLVGSKASIILSLCKFSSDVQITASNGESVGALVDNDGATATIEYEGEPGTLTLSFAGTTYLHKLTIFNTTTTNYEVNGDWIIVKEGDASSLVDAIEAAKAGTRIFLPNGTYDLGQKTLTTIGSNNVSIIGQSMEGVIIKNRPVKEGIAITATLLNKSTDLYMQDLTLDCIAPYGTGDDTKTAERGVTLQDKGNQTILKNVYLKGLQDTYYSNNNSGTFYFEDGKIEGSVDYVCGNGDVYFNKTTFYTVNKSTGAVGGVIAAPNTRKDFGYVFNECTLDGAANEDGKYRLGRPWAANTNCLFLNTTMKIQSTAAGWDDWSPANAVSRFAEYNSVDATGNAIDLSSRKSSFNGVANNPVLNENEAADFAVDKIFSGEWKPQVIATQVEAPAGELDGNTISWEKVDGATAYGLFNNDVLMAIVDGETTSYTIENSNAETGAPALRRADDNSTPYTLRAANSRGGFGEAKIISKATGIKGINAELNGDVKIYDMQGRQVKTATKGVYIINGKKVVIK